MVAVPPPPEEAEAEPRRLFFRVIVYDILDDCFQDMFSTSCRQDKHPLAR